jgi:hypothetical protein
MTTANEAWMDSLIRHQVGLMRLAPGISADVNDLLNKSEADMVRQIRARYAKGMGAGRLDGLLKSVRAARSTAWKDVNQLWTDAMEDIAQSEPAFLDQSLHAVSPAVLETTLPTAQRLGDIAKASPFQGRVMGDWAQRVQQGDLDRIEQQIKIGLLQGEDVASISKRLVGTVQMKGTDGVTQITRNNADALTRTSVNAISNAAKQEYYGANADLFHSEVFLATLDARTTLICASNDNKQFEIGKGPVPPLHWRCRSLRLATLNGEVIGDRPMRNFTEKQLLQEYADKHNLGKITKRDQLPHGSKGSFDTFARGRMRELTGTVPARTSYQEWLKGQSPTFQDDVLGKTRGQLFREGGLSLDKFVNQNGDRITLEQLGVRDHFELDLASGPMRGAPKALTEAEVRFDLLGATVKNNGAPKALVEHVAGELDRAGWKQLFKGYAGSSIEFHGGRIPEAPKANGRMAGKLGRMQLATARPGGAGSNWSISEMAETATERVTRTAIHEMGHAVHMFENAGVKGSVAMAKKADAAILSRFSAGDREFLTKYADTNHKEYFAEAFSAYHSEPLMLYNRAPKAYAMVEEVLEVRKLPKNSMNLKPRVVATAPVAVETRVASSANDMPELLKKYEVGSKAELFEKIRDIEDKTPEQLADWHKMNSLWDEERAPKKPKVEKMVAITDEDGNIIKVPISATIEDEFGLRLPNPNHPLFKVALPPTEPVRVPVATPPKPVVVAPKPKPLATPPKPKPVEPLVASEGTMQGRVKAPITPKPNASSLEKYLNASSVELGEYGKQLPSMAQKVELQRAAKKIGMDQHVAKGVKPVRSVDFTSIIAKTDEEYVRRVGSEAITFNSSGHYLSPNGWEKSSAIRLKTDNGSRAKLVDLLAEEKAAIANGAKITLPRSAGDVDAFEYNTTKTFIHEYGHHLHMYDGKNSTVDAAVNRAWHKAVRKAEFVSEYGKTNANEWFAENYAAYHTYPREWLTRNAPNCLAIVEEVLKLRGIL